VPLSPRSGAPASERGYISLNKMVNTTDNATPEYGRIQECPINSTESHLENLARGTFMKLKNDDWVVKVLFGI
jgi:hypothetical protein